jgi:hypothetical protein
MLAEMFLNDAKVQKNKEIRKFFPKKFGDIFKEKIDLSSLYNNVCEKGEKKGGIKGENTGGIKGEMKIPICP